MTAFIAFLSTFTRGGKVALQLLVDAALVVFCFLAAMTIRLESFIYLENEKIWLPLAISTALALFIFWWDGLYKSLVRFITGKIILSIIKGAAAFAGLLLVINSILVSGIPRSVPFISIMLILLSIGGLRFLVRQIFRMPMQFAKKNVIIYGAGETGLELLNSLFHSRDYAPVAFVDDNKKLQGLTISGYEIYPSSEIPKLAKGGALEAILLAMPSVSHAKRREILSSLEGLGVEVKTIPELSDLISGKAKISELRNVTVEDLLGREPVAPNEDLLKHNIAGKTVMVTGAGGSIGSELCRQALLQGPAKLVLYEISEFALYSIENELSEKAKADGLNTIIVPVLGSVQNSHRLEKTIQAFDIATIYHAAAYKHVPLIEENIVEGIQNNVLGTHAVASLANKHGVESFILISTDKAVRPSNVMGATKRIAELICQAFAGQNSKTTYSMVRFGNVLGSSGSVTPRFRSQIESGGPVTVTHPEINRYFMTIPEASQLVVQAGAMANGGEVFVLDMGEPVKIADLAVAMVNLNGLTPYFINDPAEISLEKGDIPICFTGLRKGEKLYEELLIGNDPKQTKHPRIMAASEISISMQELETVLNDLKASCQNLDIPAIQSTLRALPLEYAPTEDNPSDLLWNAASSASAPNKLTTAKA